MKLYQLKCPGYNRASSTILPREKDAAATPIIEVKHPLVQEVCHGLSYMLSFDSSIKKYLHEKPEPNFQFGLSEGEYPYGVLYLEIQFIKRYKECW
ncbi:hypothetical protein ASG65_21340 [Bacillus sp. Leaf13]|nr:hypothetical protein ASG65_21340 [Bacillus sp. Leaf13]